MATRPNITLPANAQVDVYAALNAQSGFPSVTVGEALNIALIGDGTVRLSEKSTEPVANDGYREMTTGFITFNIASGSPGVWAYSPTVAAQINVEVG